MVSRSAHFLSLKRTHRVLRRSFPREDARARCVVQPRLWLANGWREIKRRGNVRAGWSKKRAKPRGHVSKNDALSRNAAHLFSGSVHRRADAECR